MKSILIVKTSAIGDVIHSFPVLEYLRSRYPKARIDWVVERSCFALLEAHPHLDNIYCIDTKSWRKKPFSAQTWSEIKRFKEKLTQNTYDLLFDLQGNTKSAFITGMAQAKEKVGFGRKSVHEIANLLVTRTRYEIPLGINVRERYLRMAQLHLRDSSPFQSQGMLLNAAEDRNIELSSPLMMVAFGSKWKNKRLKVETLKEFLAIIHRELKPSFLFIYGDAEEKKIAEELQAAFSTRSRAIGELTLPVWQRMMGKVDCVIAMDSAGLHLCGTTSTPSFSVFGPSYASVFKPLGGKHGAFQGTCPYNRAFVKDRCPILRTCSTGACMQNISAQELASSFLSWWQIPMTENKIGN